jgi:hypothetical protein
MNFAPESSYRPLYGYYYVHGQYVPGAGDRLIYGPGYVFVLGHGILGEDCNMPTSTCLNDVEEHAPSSCFGPPPRPGLVGQPPEVPVLFQLPEGRCCAAGRFAA